MLKIVSSIIVLSGVGTEGRSPMSSESKSNFQMTSRANSVCKTDFCLFQVLSSSDWALRMGSLCWFLFGSIADISDMSFSVDSRLVRSMSGFKGLVFWLRSNDQKWIVSVRICTSCDDCFGGPFNRCAPGPPRLETLWDIKTFSDWIFRGRFAEGILDESRTLLRMHT
jgi:hypothetical protein